MDVKDIKREPDQITEAVIGCAIEVHRLLGPGLLESAYEECLVYELQKKMFEVERQVALPIIHKGVEITCGYRIDILIPNKLVIELKTVERFLPIHHSQLLTYLRISGIRIGLLLNFSTTLLKNGINHVIL